MWKKLSPERGPAVTLLLAGRTVSVPADISVAAALLANGMEACRTTPVRGAARGPYCHMGVCFDCLVTIDGVPNRQACMTTVAEGMRVEPQQRARDVAW